MKRVYFFLFTLLTCITLQAYDAEIGGIYYNFNGFYGGKATVTNGETNYSGNLIIPDSVSYGGRIYYVRTIGYHAFNYCINLKSVTLPQNLREIQNNAFNGCRGLSSIIIPESVTTIAEEAFSGCYFTQDNFINNSSLTSNNTWGAAIYEKSIVETDDGLVLKDDTLLLCRSWVNSVAIPDNVTCIKNGAFSSCTDLTSITIPNGITSIEGSTFSGCSGLTSITISESVTSIGESAFFGCSSLTSITIPESVTYIGNHAFMNCSNLQSTTIPKNVTSIEDGTFQCCAGLTSILLPEGLTNIGRYAFKDCQSLKSITIPNSVTSINEYTFSGCSNLYAVTIGSGVTQICEYAFKGCNNLCYLTVNRESPPSIPFINLSRVFETSDIALFVPSGCRDTYYRTEPWSSFRFENIREIKEYTEIKGIYYNLITKGKVAEVRYNPNSYIGDLEIPSSVIYNGESYSVTGVGEDAFFYCKGLTSVTLPESVTTIGNYAFCKCKNLSFATIPEKVTTIGESTFNQCIGLTSITIPKSVTIIGKSAFSGCSGLTSINISESVTTIGESAFSSCNGLTAITIPEGVTSIGNYVFQFCQNLSSITLPNSITTISFGAFSACPRLTYITIPTSVTTIGGNAFSECTGLTSIDIPESVTTIDGGAFKNCTGLTSIDIPESVTTIGSDAFLGCTFLSSVGMSDNVSSIGSGAFSGCTSLSSITLPNKLSSINDFVFQGCTSLTSIIIPANVTSIGLWAFRDCTSLTSITPPKSMSTIAKNAFQGCTALTSFNIPEGVIKIDQYVFFGCSSLNSITIPKSVSLIEYNAFKGCSSLKSVSIPDGVVTISDEAFDECSALSTVTIGKKMQNIYSRVFANCTELKDVYCYAEEIPKTNATAFEGSFVEYATLHVPAVSTEKYKSTEPWSNFGSIVSLEGESEDDSYIDGIYYDFSDNDAKVVKGENAYSGDVVIPASVIYKGKTFSVTSIGDFAFFQCNGLTSVSIPESITTIGQLAFANCSGLTSIDIPNSITNIGVGAFAECTSLKTITIPESVTSISESLLSGCSSLTSITIPKNVTSIGESAFAYCSKLKNVYSYAEQVPSTTDNAFENTPIQSAVLQVPTSSAKELYKTTAPWSGFGTIIAQTGEEVSEDGPQLENSSFDEWHVVGSGNKALYNPWKEGGTSYWDTGNKGATTVGASNSTYGIEDGRTYANLQSKFIVIKFAAGNIFTGSYLKTDGSNGILSLGRPFNGYPSKLQFDYTYKSSIVNKGGGKWDERYSRYISQQTYDEMRGKPDSCCIWIALIGDKDEEEYEGVTYPYIIRTRPSTLKLFDPNSDNVIAYASFTSGDDQEDWTTRTISLNYRHSNRTPKYIIVVATSSKYGDYFIGGDGSLLKLDNLKLLYDDNHTSDGDTIAQSSVWDGTSCDKSWYEEGKTEYHINSAAQFRGLSELTDNDAVSFEGKTIFLDCDIDLDNKQWTPIGLYNSKQFAGIFDGNGHSISHLNIDTSQLGFSEHVGLFGYASRAEIRNLKIQGEINVGQIAKYIGGVAAFVKRVENIHSDISIKLGELKSDCHIGTVAADATDAVNINAKGKIYGIESYNGLIGSCWCGGIVGLCTNMQRCTSNVEINISRYDTSKIRIGGLSGAASSISNGLFIGSIVISNINCTTDQFIPTEGGICGDLSTGDHLISAPQKMSYGRGWETGKSIITPQSSNATITDSYYLDTWAVSSESYGIAISEAELKSGKALPNFDSEIWAFKQGEYPSLKADEEELIDEKCMIAGVYYELNQSDNTAKVVSCQVDYSSEITIPSSITYKGKTFNVTSIGDDAFNECEDLRSIVIPRSVTAIGKNAFYGCRLRNVLIKRITPPVVAENTFSPQTLSHSTLYIPVDCWENYAYDYYWYHFNNIRETAMSGNQLSEQQAYTLMNANTFAYSVYDPVNDCIGTVSSVGGIDENNPNHNWQLIDTNGTQYLYNIGAKKFAVKARNDNGLNLADMPEPIEITDGDNGIVLGYQATNQWALVRNERLNIDQSAEEEVTGLIKFYSNQQTDRSIYNLNGQRMAAPYKGTNIIRMSDGTIRKVLIK